MEKDVRVKYPRSPRNGYRPVSIHIANMPDEYGFLICFGPEGSLEEGISTFATVELMDGSVWQYDAYKIRFDDVITEEMLHKERIKP